MPRLTHILALIVVHYAFGMTSALAQEAPADGSQAVRQVRIDDLPPPIRLGARAETVRRAWPVFPVVVIVSDEASYLEALARWTTAGRYPVLLDDGTPECREDIARFVRGFKPRQVIRWSAGEEAAQRWSGDEAQRRRAVESVIYRMWSRPVPGEGLVAPVSTPEELRERWRRLGVIPPGIVVADVNDQAWTAAVALAVGRLQPIAWVRTRGSLGGTMTGEEFDRFASEVEQVAGWLGMSWQGLGDDLDAITVCLNMPSKVQVDAANILAMTDLLGRHGKDGDDREWTGEPGQRWGWAGQIAGNRARAAYMAMCSLFLAPESAWLFDGYPDELPWSHFDATAAAEHLKRAGLDVTVDDTPRQDLAQWRRRIVGGISAGFIAVNTKGMGHEFHLSSGQARPGDVPHLHIPSIVYFVHSYSATWLDNRDTVGARWLERGAYAYCGSVHEPTLGGFVPTPIVTARLVSAYPWGAAVRMDNGRPWKIAVMGDPLMAIGPPAPRVGDDVRFPLEGKIDLETLIREALQESQYEEAFAVLSLLGRDEQASRLAAALLAERPEALSAHAAEASLMSLFRVENHDVFLAIYRRLSPEHAAAGWRRDALWHLAHPRLGAIREREVVDLLQMNPRLDQVGRDATELAAPMNRLIGYAQTLDMLEKAKQGATPSEREALDRTITDIQDRPRRR